jgi:hypothetical protein
MFGIYRTKNSSQWKVSPGNYSLNLIWLIHSIHLRPFLQNVYSGNPKDFGPWDFFMLAGELAHQASMKKPKIREADWDCLSKHPQSGPPRGCAAIWPPLLGKQPQAQRPGFFNG